MADIVLMTANARSAHTAFGLRCLRANMGDLRDRTQICEFTIDDKPSTIVEEILAQQPVVVGIGVYIWNVTLLTEVTRLLKTVAPDVKVVLGGPEVSYEYETSEIVGLADILITGEADLAFANCCREIVEGQKTQEKVIVGGAPDLSTILPPYAEYNDEDVCHRLVYVEASRGCAFRCSFCLSSLDIAVRSFPLDQFLIDMDRLLERGCRSFKFVDRTFNLRLKDSLKILDFFDDRLREERYAETFLHFEMIPDRLPTEIRERVRRFPKGAIQFEIGIQTFTPAVCEAIERRMDVAATVDNFRFLIDETEVHIHADLIAGLPGETLATFRSSFDKLVELRPHDIQLGILKRLKGTTIATEDMRFSHQPPFEIIQSKTMSFAELQKIKRLARVVDVFVNSGRFNRCMAKLVENDPKQSAFDALQSFSDWIWSKFHVEHGIALKRQFEFILGFFTEVQGETYENAVEMIRFDFLKLNSRKGMPDFLRPSPETV